MIGFSFTQVLVGLAAIRLRAGRGAAVVLVLTSAAYVVHGAWQSPGGAPLFLALTAVGLVLALRARRASR